MKTWTKTIGTIAVIGMLGTLAACESTVTKVDHDALIANLTAQNQVQLAEVNAKVTALEAQVADGALVQAELEVAKAQLANLTEQQARDAEVLKVALEEAQKLKLEKATTEAKQPSSDREVVDDLELGAPLNQVVLDNNDLSFLFDGEIEFDDEDYDVQEQIILKNTLEVGTSLASDEDLKDVAALMFTDEEAVEYRYVFDEPFNYTLVNEDDELVLNLLGKEYTIIDVGANEFTILDGTEVTLKEGEKVEVAGKTLELVTVAENDKIQVLVDGHVEVIDEGDSEDVGALNVRATEVLYSGKESVKSVATLTVSPVDAERVIQDGDEFEDGNDQFEWVISTTGDNLNHIGIVLADEASDADEAVLLPGDKLDFAGLFELGFDLEKDYKYNEYKLSFDEATAGNIPALKIESVGGENIVLGNEELDEVYYDGTNTYYKDDDNDWVTVVGAPSLENDDVVYAVSYNGTHVLIGDLELDVSSGFTQFGAVDEEAEATDLVVNGHALGTRDEDVLLEDGAVIDAPESDLDNDKLSFKIPDEVVEAIVTVGR